MLNPSSTFIRIIICAAIVPWVVVVYLKATSMLHMLQLEGYKSFKYLKWALTHLNKLANRLETAVFPALIILAYVSSYYAQPVAFYLFLSLWLGGQVFLIYKRDKTPSKKALAFTPRAARLMVIFGLILGCQMIALLFLWFKPYSTSPSAVVAELQAGPMFFLSLIILTLLTPLNILFANLLSAPLENTINWGYFKLAQRKINHLSELTVIAITGSYGKTSAKYILNSLLSPYHPTLMTPESYNTPMGICKVINDQLTDEHKYFIVEMGARQRGDIKELCRLVSPTIGVITSLGPQHLETFGTIENVVRTKFELLVGLGPLGKRLAVFNYDDPYCKEMADRKHMPHKLYGIDSKEELDLRATGIKTTNRGITFTARTAKGDKADLSTCLLGRHNVYNVLAAATVALGCGLTLSQIAQALKDVEPIPHRLQVIKGSGGITIIDDAFNSNPRGAKEALEVLKSMEGGQKILLTPGMVELGDEEYAQNKEFGRAATKACDTVILVGKKQTKPIAEGLKEAGFPDKNLIVATSLSDATNHLHKLVKPGDVVLFENDLPDNYNE